MITTQKILSENRKFSLQKGLWNKSTDGVFKNMVGYIIIWKNKSH